MKFLGRLFLCALMIFALARAALATTPLQAEAVLALKAAHDGPNGSIYEHGGMLVKNQGALRWIEPHPDNTSPDSVGVINRKMLLSGDTLVGTYHTHPCMAGYYHAYFSTSDVMVSIISTVPAFMLDECTGDVHEFFTAIDEIKDTGDDLGVRGARCERIIRHLPKGRIVGNIGVQDAEHVNVEKDECP